jgi:hypothetical protein
VLLHSTDPDVQAAFDAAGVSGRLGNPTGDFLAVVANNAAGNKADFYLERRVDYRVTLGAGGTASAAATVSLANDAPESGQPPYVIGPFDERFVAGQNVTYVSTYCAAGCLLEDFRRDRSPDAVGSEAELGHPVFPVFVDLPSGGSQSLEYRWSVPWAWAGDRGAGTYRLTIRGQPTIRPTALSLDVRAPEGMNIAHTTPPMQVSGGRAVWEGVLADGMIFEVRFQRSALGRVWADLVDFLGRPVFGLG